MVFGHGFTGIVVASIVTLSSGAAFLICAREFIRELFTRTPKFETTLRRNRDMLLDQGSEFVIEDRVFQKLMQARTREIHKSSREFQDPTAYLMTMLVLGLVAVAGFVAGLSHFS